MVSETAEIPNESWLLPRLWGLFLLLLVALTFRLWIGPPEIPGIPAIPLIPHGLRLPTLCYVVPSIVLVIGLLLVVIAPARCVKLWWLVAGSLFVSFLLDQHRLQPWAYQSAIYALIFAAMDPHRGRRFLIPLAASVYLYSAAGKFDFQFAHTVGQDFLEALANPFGGLPDQLAPSARAKIALVFPAMEFLAGLGLLFRRTRSLAAIVVMLMHASLIAILGPWGLDHSTGVLVWNLLLIVQAYLLMLKPGSLETKAATERDAVGLDQARQPGHSHVASSLVVSVVVIVLFAPVLERSGYWDHWTSWSLYSPHTSRVDIELHRSAIGMLDPYSRSFVDDDDDQD